ncbi:unnamed protein product [Paramecium sonneborni]|uniref:Thioredoxin domain-containing protein n=1 Tax=Paramecium sonneborni TaxID=65129 RepID=A0A8S1QXU7_9CILI|nr:unnamed protein product [Paramecium sonneborni]
MFDSFNIGQINPSWFILFYKSQCQHSQKFLPKWEYLGYQIKKFISVGAVDCEIEKDLCSLFQINEVPTMILFKKDANLYQYSGNRTYESFYQFLEKDYQDYKMETQSYQEAHFNLTNNINFIVANINRLSDLSLFLKKSQANNSSIQEIPGFYKSMEV